MPEMRYGHLADFATIGANGKPILVGIFDRVISIQSSPPITVPQSYLFVKLECSIGEGSEHGVAVRLRDGNGQVVGAPFELEKLPFGASGPGYPLAAYIQLTIRGLQLAEPGDYEFEIVADGERLGVVSLAAALVPPPQ